MRWFNDARFGMFIHWGLYSQLGGEWQDKHVTGGAEWIQKYLEIPSSQYSPLAKTWTARDFNPDEWVQGHRQRRREIHLHHHQAPRRLLPVADEDSTTTGTSPSPRSSAIRSRNWPRRASARASTFCIYHSVLDWHHPDWPGRPAFNDYAKGPPDKERFRNYLYGQLRELFTNYGEIGMIWLDGKLGPPALDLRRRQGT